MKLAIVGATGLVGREMLELMEEKHLELSKLFLVASKKSKGNIVRYKNQKIQVISLDDLLKTKVDVALFSAGSMVSKNWAPELAKNGCKVIDNSSYWRMFPDHKLIVPEINGNQIKNRDMIISNPNCSTIQLVKTLAPLHKKHVVKRVVVSTYQAVSGTGEKAVQQLKNEQNSIAGETVYSHQIYQNVIPKCDDFTENGYTKEEMKLTNETKKILDPNIDVVATAVRVPVLRGHSESVNISFEHDFDVDHIRKTLKNTDGIRVLDDITRDKYPTPIITQKNDNVFVGRIRRDFTKEKTLNLWIVSDNLRKGAATNTLQILDHMVFKKLI